MKTRASADVPAWSRLAHPFEERMVEVPVIKAFVYDGRENHVGERVCVPPVVAAALARQGMVSLTVGYQPSTESKPKRRRAYRRRDMVAE